jgi:hypothetical protein
MQANEYLGDSVYVHFDGRMVTVYTDNGYGATNVIHLEPEVYANLLKFVAIFKEFKEDKL